MQRKCNFNNINNNSNKQNIEYHSLRIIIILDGANAVSIK